MPTIEDYSNLLYVSALHNPSFIRAKLSIKMKILTLYFLSGIIFWLFLRDNVLFAIQMVTFVFILLFYSRYENWFYKKMFSKISQRDYMNSKVRYHNGVSIEKDKILLGDEAIEYDNIAALIKGGDYYFIKTKRLKNSIYFPANILEGSSGAVAFLSGKSPVGWERARVRFG